MIRPARPDDRTAVESIVNAAYSTYIARIGKPPGPMLDDYAALIDAGAVSVWQEGGGPIAAIIVLLPKDDHLLLDNIAVHPGHQGKGLGRQLIAFAEAEARRLGYGELRLYTHQMMTENVALYTRLGFVETGRGHDAGYDRVFMTKHRGFSIIYIMRQTPSGVGEAPIARFKPAFVLWPVSAAVQSRDPAAVPLCKGCRQRGF